MSQICSKRRTYEKECMWQIEVQCAPDGRVKKISDLDEKPLYIMPVGKLKNE